MKTLLCVRLKYASGQTWQFFGCELMMFHSTLLHTILMMFHSALLHTILMMFHSTLLHTILMYMYCSIY